ncbi:MAG: serine hydrolase domain-containing protein [Flavisolibacter sp.]
MKRKKVPKLVITFILLAVVGYGVKYCWFSFPIISGYSAKMACSCAFIQGRTKESISREELGSFPLSLGSIEINYQDSSVTGTVLGMARRKAIYRKGLGCTLVNDLSEEEVRSQRYHVPTAEIVEDTSWQSNDSVAVNKSKLQEATRTAFVEQYNKKPVLTRALLIIHNNRIIAEQYAPGYNKNSMFLGWSIAKSVTGALIGILVKQNKLSTAQKAPVPLWQNAKDGRENITIENLLQQMSGLNFREDYSSYSSATNMLFNRGNMAAFTESLRLKVKPGTEFYYSSGNSNILAGIIRQTVGEEEYHAFPYEELFYKLGMYHTLMEPDASGTYVGSSYIWASARDYARLGMFYLRDGVWNNEAILPAWWVKASVTAPAANKLKNYGYQFWLNGLEGQGSNKEFPDMPDDFFYADGYGGQRIYIVPSKQLVAVRLGLNKFDEHRFLKQLMEAVKD